jgi:hypothetical protein
MRPKHHLFYRVPVHGSYHVVFTLMQAFYTKELPCFWTRWKRHPVSNCSSSILIQTPCPMVLSCRLQALYMIKRPYFWTRWKRHPVSNCSSSILIRTPCAMVLSCRLLTFYTIKYPCFWTRRKRHPVSNCSSTTLVRTLALWCWAAGPPSCLVFMPGQYLFGQWRKRQP